MACSCMNPLRKTGFHEVPEARDRKWRTIKKPQHPKLQTKPEMFIISRKYIYIIHIISVFPQKTIKFPGSTQCKHLAEAGLLTSGGCDPKQKLLWFCHRQKILQYPTWVTVLVPVSSFAGSFAVWSVLCKSLFLHCRLLSSPLWPIPRGIFLSWIT